MNCLPAANVVVEFKFFHNARQSLAIHDGYAVNSRVYKTQFTIAVGNQFTLKRDPSATLRMTKKACVSVGRGLAPAEHNGEICPNRQAILCLRQTWRIVPPPALFHFVKGIRTNIKGNNTPCSTKNYKTATVFTQYEHNSFV